jgi:hypothetical protein
MKQILIKIDDRVFETLQNRKQFNKSFEGCFNRKTTLEEDIIFKMIEKIQNNEDFIELAIVGEEIQ